MTSATCLPLSLPLGEQCSWERRSDLMSNRSHRDRALWIFPLSQRQALFQDLTPGT